MFIGLKGVAAVFLFASLIIGVSAEEGLTAYDIIFDCGSTGSRLYVFEKKFCTEKLISSEVVGKKKPGLSSYVGKPEEEVFKSYEFLFDLFDKKYGGTLREGIRTGTHASVVPVNFFGTAGMRLLEEFDQQVLWASVRKYCEQVLPNSEKWKDSGVRFEIGESKTISGEEEGYYAIRGVNYLTSIANDGDITDNDAQYGILDLGGSSTQIGVPHKGKKITKDSTTVYSFLSMGMEKMREAVEKNYSPAERAPCFFDQFEHPAQSESPYKCIEMIETQMKAVASNPASTEMSQSWMDLAVADIKFIAVSGYLYVTDFARHLLIHANNEISYNSYLQNYPWPSVNDIEVAAEKICKVAWSSVKDMHESNRHQFTSKTKLPHRCFEMNYIASLLSMYTVPKEERNVWFTDEIGGSEVEWPIGQWVLDHDQTMFIEGQREMLKAAEKEL